MNEPIHCFLDESGDPNFPAGAQGRSTHFVLAAVIVTESNLERVRAEADAVRAAHFGTGEMKAKARAMRRVETRRAVVDAIAALDASFAVVAVDKRELYDDSPLVAWKKSFLKYTGNQLYRRLFASHDSVRVLADDYGRADYKDEFARYLAKRNRFDLFLPSSTFAFGDSATEPLIQAADIVAGTVMRSLRDGDDEDRAMVAQLREKLFTYIGWPPVYPPVEPPRQAGEQAERDATVRNHALSKAGRYLEEHREAYDALTVARVATLDRLVYAAQFDEASSFVNAGTLVQMIREMRLESPVSKRWLSSSVIGPLRDEGVVITGSSRGYAIPFRSDELDEHARDVRTKAVPMLRRLSRYRADLYNSTGGAIDILASGDLEDVRRLVNVLEGPGTE